MEKSVQQMMDERMCRPGYRWNDTLKRCLAAGGVGNGEEIGDLPDAEVEPKPGEKPGVPTKSAEGRGSVRVNANGVKQTGTAMGKSVSIK